MSEHITTAIHDQVFEIVLNRPEKRNAITLDMLTALDQAVQTAGRTDGLRAVVLRGEGKSFSAGIDVTMFMLLAQTYGQNWPLRMRTITADMQTVLNHLERLELPTIALLHGHCLGLALELALACDLRLAAEGTQVGLPETRLGIIPDVGGTTRLTRLIGPGRAKELILTGKKIDATLAEQWGLVNHVVPAEALTAAGEQLIADLKQAAPLAVGMAKRVIDGLHDQDRGLQLEAWAQSQLFQSEDFQVAVQAFVTGQTPEFKGK